MVQLYRPYSEFSAYLQIKVAREVRSYMLLLIVIKWFITIDIIPIPIHAVILYKGSNAVYICICIYMHHNYVTGFAKANLLKSNIMIL